MVYGRARLVSRSLPVGFFPTVADCVTECAQFLLGYSLQLVVGLFAKPCEECGDVGGVARYGGGLACRCLHCQPIGGPTPHGVEPQRLAGRDFAQAGDEFPRPAF